MSSSTQSQALTPLEQDVLDEYRTLLDNVNKLSSIITTITNEPTAQILDSLRLLERKTGLACTLMKASVYSIVLQQEMHEQQLLGAAGVGRGGYSSSSNNNNNNNNNDDNGSRGASDRRRRESMDDLSEGSSVGDERYERRY